MRESDHGVTILAIFEMLEVLQTHSAGISREKLAEKLGRNTRTIKRYIESWDRVCQQYPQALAIESYKEGRRSYVKIQRTQLAPSSSDDSFLYGVMHSAMSHFGAMDSRALTCHMETALEPLEKSLGDRTSSHIRRCFHYLPFGPKTYRTQTRTLETIMSALVDKTSVRLSYQKPHSDTPDLYLFNPWSMMVYRDGLYVVGERVEKNGEPASGERLLAVDRIQSATPTNQKFTVDAGFDPSTHYEGCFGIHKPSRPGEEVLIQLAFGPGELVWAKERRWPGFQEWKKTPGGEEVLYLRVYPSGEFYSWILGWGGKVRVLSPFSVREEVRKRLQNALDSYKN